MEKIYKEIWRSTAHYLGERKIIVKSVTRPGHYMLGDSGFSHYLYLEFSKEDFPALKYPGIAEGSYMGSELDLDSWHGGCTFYQELKYSEYGKTVVKIGCDYQHYRDDHYGEGDLGESILRGDGQEVLAEFIRLVETKEKHYEESEISNRKLRI